MTQQHKEQQLIKQIVNHRMSLESSAIRTSRRPSEYEISSDHQPSPDVPEHVEVSLLQRDDDLVYEKKSKGAVHFMKKLTSFKIRKPSLPSEDAASSEDADETLVPERKGNRFRRLKKISRTLKRPVSREQQRDDVVACSEHGTIEISLSKDEDEKRCAHRSSTALKKCKHVAGKHCSRAAEKISERLSSLIPRKHCSLDEKLHSCERKPNGNPDAETAPTTTYEDCPICLGPMTDPDVRHPLHCTSPHCDFNFCVSCIQSFIKSSTDEYEKASDGSYQVKVSLQCPNCRCSLAQSIGDTLLLRTAEIEMSKSRHHSSLFKIVSSSITMCHVVGDDPNQASFSTTQSEMDAVESAIAVARQNEKEFFMAKRASPLPLSSQPQQEPEEEREEAESETSEEEENTSDLEERPEPPMVPRTKNISVMDGCEERQVDRCTIRHDTELSALVNSGIIGRGALCFLLETQL